jgi:hypothetical protein
VNFPVHPDRLRIDANLRGWSEFCREVTAEELPKTILHVCQAVYEAIAPGRPCIAIKRAVLRQVAAGDCSGAVGAMLPTGFEARFEALPQGKVLAELSHAGSQTRVAAEGKARDAALLGCLIELSLTTDPVRRVQLFGLNLGDSPLPADSAPAEGS